MNALKRLPLLAAGYTRTITTLRVSLPLTISPTSSLTRDTLFSPWSAVQSRGAKIKSTDLEAGDVIERKGRIYKVVKATQQKGKGGTTTIQADLCEVGTGNKIEQKMGSDEAFESVFVEGKSLTFLYTEGDSVILMEPSTYEQTEVPKDLFGKSIAYLKDEMQVTLNFYDGNPMSASVPPLLTCTVIKETSPKEGQTAIPNFKSVLLDNGITTQVPHTIEAGAEVLINTADDSYRANKDDPGYHPVKNISDHKNKNLTKKKKESE